MEIHQSRISKLLAGWKKKLLQAVISAKGGVIHRYKYRDVAFAIDHGLRDTSMTEPDLQYWGSTRS